MIDSRTDLLIKIGGIVREMSADELFGGRIELDEWSNVEEILPDLYVPNIWRSYEKIVSVYMRSVRPGEIIVEVEIDKHLKIAMSGNSSAVITDGACKFIGCKPAKSFKLGDFIPVANRVLSPGLPGDMNPEFSDSEKNIVSNKLSDYFHAKQLCWISKTIVSEEGAENHLINAEKTSPDLFSKIRRIISEEVSRLVNFRLEKADKYRTSQGFLVVSM